MKPGYFTLKRNHFSSDMMHPNYRSPGDLYKDIGYDISELYKQNRGYANTCATRMSLALIRSGVHFKGRIRIKEGPYKGTMIEPGAKLLADQLILPTAFGYPLILQTPSTTASELQNKKGVIFFWKIDGYDGGHIDLIESSDKEQTCNSHCYFACKEVWFWELT